MAITPFLLRRAYFFDNFGVELGNKYFKKTDEKIRYDNRTFFTPMVFKKPVTKKLRLGLLWNEEEYFYNIDTPEPLVLNKKVEPQIQSELYDVMLETNILRELASISKGKFNIDFKTVVIALIVIVGIVMFIGKGGA